MYPLDFEVIEEALFGRLAHAIGHRSIFKFFDEAGEVGVELIEFGDVAVGLQQKFAELRGLQDDTVSDNCLG